MRSRAILWGLWLLTAVVTASGIVALGRRDVASAVEGSDASVEWQQRLVGTRLPDLRLRLLDDDYTRLELQASPAGRSHIFVVLTQADCHTRLADVDFWRSVDEQFGADASVMVIAAGERPHVLQYYLSQQRIALPVLFDSTAAVASLLAREGVLTPAIVLTMSDGVIRGVYAGTHGNPQVQAAHLRSMEALLSGVRQDATSASGEGRP